MADELYVTGVVIPNGIPDHENDVLTKKEIKTIFTKYINRDTDTMHTRIKNQGVEVLANWISEADRTIDGKVAPAGSWLATFKITNNEIIQSIRDGDINGISLGSVRDTALTQKFWFINKSINYRDVEDMDEVVPLFISFVDKPSNMFGLEIEEYDVYINKNITEEVDIMAENQKPIEEEKLSLSGWERVIKGFQSLGINKSETEEVETEEVEINKDATATEEPVKSDDITNKELLEKIPNAVATGITSAFENMAENKPAEEKVEKVETKPAEEEKEEEKEEEEVEINKRATSKTENVTQPNTTTNFYEKAGRDMFGCRIKKLE